MSTLYRKDNFPVLQVVGLSPQEHLTKEKANNQIKINILDTFLECRRNHMSAILFRKDQLP